MTTTATPPAAQAHAQTDRVLALLAAGHTVTQTADVSGWPERSIRKLVENQSGWLIDPEGRAYDPGRTGYTVQLPADVDPSLLAWAKGMLREPTAVRAEAKPLRPAAPAPSAAPLATPTAAPGGGAQQTRGRQIGALEELLADAKACDDKRVQAALLKARTALDGLRERLTAVKERHVAEQARAQAKAAARAEVERLEQELADARARAKQLTRSPAKQAAPTGTGKPKPSGADKARNAAIRAWAAEQGIQVAPLGRLPVSVAAQYDAAVAAAGTGGAAP